jgi:hypothetical protein
VYPLGWGTVLSSFFERLPPIPRFRKGRFIVPAVVILSVYFPLKSIIRFAYSKYLRSILSIRDILYTITRGIIFRSLRIISSP